MRDQLYMERSIGFGLISIFAFTHPRNLVRIWIMSTSNSKHGEIIVIDVDEPTHINLARRTGATSTANGGIIVIDVDDPTHTVSTRRTGATFTANFAQAATFSTNAATTSRVAAAANSNSNNSSPKKTKRGAKRTTPKKHPKPKEEKRLRRFRSKMTKAIEDRIARARTQRLYLIDISLNGVIPSSSSESNKNEHEHNGSDDLSISLAVLGSTGNVYEVTLSKLLHCTCPDHAKGNLCKHILFVMLKVVGLPSNSPLVYQSALLSTEVEELYHRLAIRRSNLGITGAVLANEAVRERFACLKSEKTDTEKQDSSSDDNNRRKEVEGDCPICFDELGTNMSTLTYCKTACGTNFHSECIKMWISQCKPPKEATCPACRTLWPDVKKKKNANANANEGYTNLADLSGQNQYRDTSSYMSRQDFYYRY